MISGMYSAILGLRAFQRKAEVAARNIANVNTTSFRKNRAFIHQDRSGHPYVEVGQAEASLPTPPDTLKGQGEGYSPLSDVDLGEELVELMVAQRAHQANIKTLQAADDMLGQLVDLKT